MLFVDFSFFFVIMISASVAPVMCQICWGGRDKIFRATKILKHQKEVELEKKKT